ncbi:transposase [Brucella melitensis bv. 1 str. 16M]|uniref:Transposase n=1 Tax=Brucella melitensis biotype 1 (strain ATCC 23456 / CCUG 17765 / NCTC 10094 / 16M) TaxID=224914 RepID=Q8YC19_BRUME|nr:transposase [Brucella melitensis bv. 1 str. 16M]
MAPALPCRTMSPTDQASEALHAWEPSRCYRHVHIRMLLFPMPRQATPKRGRLYLPGHDAFKNVIEPGIGIEPFQFCRGQQGAQYGPGLGTAITAGEQAYKSLTRPDRRAGSIALAYCLAHARRKFVDVFKKYKSELAKVVIERLAEVYAIEASIRSTSAEHRLGVRQAKSKVLMADLKMLLMDTLKDISAKDPVASAIKYTLGHWAGLTLFLEDGRLEVDSNTVERNMRSVALGRVNSLVRINLQNPAIADQL